FPQVAIDFFKEREMMEKGANGREIAAVAALFVAQAEKRSKAKKSAQSGEVDMWKMVARRESVNGGGWIL
ncbi:MAG: hypothetical protein LUQ16_10560, partial [Methanomassiliicoccales archaeon]|nr:hypothetical protein [Methanomassiliicoccales archaeon]